MDAYERTVPFKRSTPQKADKGITVCEEWLDYLTFKSWALENNWKAGLTIERKDISGNYEPENCCLIEHGEQSRNRSISVKVMIDGEEVYLCDIVRDMTGNRANRIRSRIREGKTIEEALGPIKTYKLKRELAQQ
jgi:hypothetical protein